MGTAYVGDDVVAYHYGGGYGGLGLQQGVVEELRAGLVGASVFGEYDTIEVMEQTAGLELLVLHFVEAIAAHVDAIVAAAKVIHQFASAIYEPGFATTEVEKHIAHLQAIIFGGAEGSAVGRATFAQWAAKTFDDEVIACDLASGILFPQLGIGLPVGDVEVFGLAKVLIELKVLE